MNIIPQISYKYFEIESIKLQYYILKSNRHTRLFIAIGGVCRVS